MEGRTIICVLVLFPLTFGAFFPLGGCREQLPPSEVSDAHDALLRALRSRDPVALYEMSGSELKDRMKSLYDRIHKVEEGLIHPEFDGVRKRLEEGLLTEHLIDVHSPKDLFVSLVDFHGVMFDEGIGVGLEIKSAEVEGDKALVRTQSREIFVFDRDADGTWKSRLALEALEMWPVYHRLLENLGQAEQLIAQVEVQAQPLSP